MAKKTVMMRSVDALKHGFPREKYNALVKRNGLAAARSIRVPVEVDDMAPKKKVPRKVD